MKFIPYTDEFGGTQYFNPELVTHTQAHHFVPKDENWQVPEEHQGCVIGLGSEGYVVAKEKGVDVMARILEALDVDN